MSLRSPLFVVALLVCAACGGNPVTPTPTPPPVGALLLTCPSNVSLDTEITPLLVNYSPPVATGGSAPISTTCTVVSGTGFSAGNTDVICTAMDGAARSAQCTFSVTVNLIRRLKGTKFLAFGDSLTQGEVSQPVMSLHAVDPLNSYPQQLLGMLKTRYTPQVDDIKVDNAGAQGETVAIGEDRLVSLVAAGRPDVLLLMEGSNDVNNGRPAHQIGQSLRADIRRAYQNGVKLVLLATLPPEVAGRVRAFNPEGILDANDEIRRIAPLEGAVLVDVFGALAPMKELLIGIDGLHPTTEGYKKVAEAFAAVIQNNFEATPMAPPTTPSAIWSAPLTRPGRY